MKNVLVVDDEPMIRDLIRQTLEDRYKVVEASNGEEALRLLESSRPDLIILDIMMPGIDGYTVVAKVRGNPRTKDIPVLILSAKTGEVYERISERFGAVDHVGKPIGIESLAEKVSSILGD